MADVPNDEPSEDYDIVPHKRLIELQRQVEDLKKNPYGSTDSGKKMMETMTSLTTSIDGLLTLFKDAAQEMRVEEHDVGILSKNMRPLMEKLDELIEQNKKIARGIIAIADMVKEHGERLDQLSGPGQRRPLPGVPLPPGKQLRPFGPSGFGPVPGHMPPAPGMFAPGPMQSMQGPMSAMIPPGPSEIGMGGMGQSGNLPPPPGFEQKKKGWF